MSKVLAVKGLGVRALAMDDHGLAVVLALAVNDHALDVVSSHALNDHAVNDHALDVVSSLAVNDHNLDVDSPDSPRREPRSQMPTQPNACCPKVKRKQTRGDVGLNGSS